MSHLEMNLHSENFEICRVCLLEPESNREIRFFNIFGPNNDCDLSQKIMQFYGLVIRQDDYKPKVICENCYQLMREWMKIKEQSTESNSVLTFVQVLRYSNVSNEPATSRSSALLETNQSSLYIPDIPTHSKNTNETTNACSSLTHSQSKPSTSNDSGIKSGIQQNFCSGSSSNNTSEVIDQTCEISNVANEVIHLSENESANESIQKNEFINEDTIPRIIYCSICKERKYKDHDCSQFNKEFSTCLVPHCNKLFRSFEDLTPHYRQHFGIPTEAAMCRRCYKENKKSDRDENGCHIKCFRENLFHCYTCKLTLNNMPELAFHKLKIHFGQLVTSSGNYLCIYCENSFPDIAEMNKHIRINNCHENPMKTITVNDMKQKEPENESVTGENDVQNIHNQNQTIIPHISKQLLFTCLIPGCDLIFSNFQVFKLHHREHGKIGNALVCWQCCSSFPDMKTLRQHQKGYNCQTHGTFECFECSEKYNEIQSLSIHKFIVHNGKLIANGRKNNVQKTIKCAYCTNKISTNNFKAHLIRCQIKEEKM